MMSCQRYIEELRAIEDSLILIIDEASEGYLTENTKDRLVQLESRKKKKLYEQEATWRLKSSIVWLMARDDNTKKNHNVAKGKKSTNTIWELHDLEGNRASLFEDLANMGKSHFESLFK